MPAKYAGRRTISIRQSTFEALRDAPERVDRSMSDVVEELIAKWLGKELPQARPAQRTRVESHTQAPTSPVAPHRARVMASRAAPPERPAPPPPASSPAKPSSGRPPSAPVTKREGVTGPTMF